MGLPGVHERGISLLTGIGAVAIRGQEHHRRHLGTAAAYGTATALIADEAALLIDLQDVYWAQAGPDQRRYRGRDHRRRRSRDRQYPTLVGDGTQLCESRTRYYRVGASRMSASAARSPVWATVNCAHCLSASVGPDPSQ